MNQDQNIFTASPLDFLSTSGKNLVFAGGRIVLSAEIISGETVYLAAVPDGNLIDPGITIYCAVTQLDLNEIVATLTNSKRRK